MSLSKSLPKATDEQAIILHKKYAAAQIGKLDDHQLATAAKILVIKIHMITGWVVPDDERRAILNDQFAKKLAEDYDMLNTEEIEYAFRKSGTTIQDWGKEMNLNLLDQVLLPYLNIRLQASATEEQIKRRPPEQKIYSDEEILNERRGQLEAAYQCMRSGRIPVMFDYFAELLVADGFIADPKDQADFFVTCLNENREELYVRE